MSALTADRATKMRDGNDTPVQVAASATIYTGSLVCADADGFAVPAADTAGLRFLGMAIEQKDNSAGADGDLAVVVRSGCQVLIGGSGLAQTMVGDTLCAADDQTVAAASATTNDIAVGTLAQYVSTTSAWVAI